VKTVAFMDRIFEKIGVERDGEGPSDIRVKDERFFDMSVLCDLSLKVGEAYVEGWWECDRLDELFYKVCRAYQDANLAMLPTKIYVSLKNTLFNLQNHLRSKKVAKEHYDLGNDLYSAMLGSSMAYTCAYWKNAQTLDDAQYAKFDLICRKIGLKAGERVLELGCGWGSFAKFAAEKYGCYVTAVNISTEQIAYARRTSVGLPVTIIKSDYRDARTYNPHGIAFDKIVSIGLCEHVGQKNYRKLMHIARANLKEDGLFLLHTIGKNVTGNYIDPWINKYIFPNGMLPSLSQLSKAAEGQFIIEDVHNLSTHYDKTLMAWHENFDKNWPELQMIYGERFYRLWSYYLLSCAGSFRARGMQLWQIVLSPKGVLGGYESIR
jgi:cyclopropane-fatty-acyl-phospholipid synthase